MRKLSIVLLLISISFMTMEANNLSERRTKHLVFAFSGIKESDPFGFVFRVYEDAKLQKVIDNLSIFINCILFKEDIIQ